MRQPSLTSTASFPGALAQHADIATTWQMRDLLPPARSASSVFSD
jgi:hypothetical protein